MLLTRLEATDCAEFSRSTNIFLYRVITDMPGRNSSRYRGLDFVRKLRARIRPAPGNLKRCQFDLGKIRVAVPQRCPQLRFENLMEGHL